MNANANLGKSVEYKKSEAVPSSVNANDNRSEIKKSIDASNINYNNRED